MRISKANIAKVLFLFLSICLLVTSVLIVNALSNGDGMLLKRSPEETCHGCHKTGQNAPADANSLKTHNSTNTGSSKWAAEGGWGIAGGKYGKFLCTTCHTAHGTKNIYLLRETIATPDGTNWASSNTPTVSPLFKKKSLADSPNPGVSDGVMGDDADAPRSSSTRICQVCHSLTNKHSYAIAADSGHQNATDCTQCHSHAKAFTHGGGSGTGCGTANSCHGTQGAHAPHVGTQIGANCSECHDTNNFPSFKDGQNLANTSVCNNCHTAAGAITAKQYWNHPGSSSGAEGSWAATTGESGFCGSCHGTAAGNTQGNGGGNAAPNIMGNGTSYGFALTGHGKSSGNYQKLSWQDSAATGNPGANKACSACHDLASAHFNTPNKRLKSGYENDANNSNCRQCHNPGIVATSNPQWYTTYADYQNSAHSGYKCTVCHDVHGATGTFAAMTTADKQNLCNNCHESAGGHPGVGTKTFTVNSKNYTLQCTSCHNVHIVTGKYSQADQNKSPITRFLDNTHVWGAEPGEKMNSYAGSGTYRTPNGESLSGSQLPDYPTFCLDCHGAGGSGSVFFGIDWTADHHGKGSANQPNGYGTCPNWFACGKASGWDGDDCTGTQEECWPVVPRGKGDQLFSRFPFNHEERIAGANFVLSCTDCHTGHGTGTLGRPNVNGGAFTSNWNSMCDRCHYYYSDWHAGMSCGNASCHVSTRMNNTGTATPHSMSSGTGSGGTRTFDINLVMNYPFENNLKDSGTWQMDGKWYSTAGSFAGGKTGQAAVLDQGKTIQVGTENAYWSTDEGYHGTWKFTEMKYNTSMEAWIYPTDNAKSEYTIFNKHVGVSTNGGYALTLKKIGGTLRATFNMAADNNAGTQDGRAGLRGAYSAVAVPLNKWTHVAATFDTSGPDRNPADPSVGRIRIYVNGEDVTTGDVSGNNMQPGPNETSIYAYSENSPWNEGICYNGSWCASEFSIGGFDWEASNFVGRIDDAKVWNVTKNAAYFVAYDGQAGPYIGEVTGLIGSNQLTVRFSEGVYTNTGSSGALVAADFTLTDVGGNNTRIITGVTHTAGASTATITMSQPLTAADINADTLAAATAGSVYDNNDLAMGTENAVIGLSMQCPTSPASIQFNESPGSNYIMDTQNILYGAVNGSGTLTGTAFSGGGDGSGRYIMFDYNNSCLKAATTMTIEARIKPTGLAGTGNYVRRILAKDGSGNYQLSLWRNNSAFTPTFNAPSGEASVALWINVVDAHGGNAWKPVLTNYTGAKTGSENNCPIVSDHWYQVKAVWNTNKPGGTTGQFFTPADIYVDDQGTDGAGAGESWSGYLNCTDSDQSLKPDVSKFYTGDQIISVDSNFAIGTNRGTPANNLFNGLIDWITWKDSAE